MSGGKGGSQTSQVEIPSWIQQPSIRNMARAEDVQQIGYQPYMGPDVAGFTQPQQQAMQSNIDAASAFGLVDPGMNAMDGMPQATDYNGLSGYSSFPLYEQAVNDMKEANPRQAQVYDSLFSEGAATNGFPNLDSLWGNGGMFNVGGYPGGMPGNTVGGGGYTPPSMPIAGPDYPGGMPDNQLASGPDMSNYFTMDQVNDLFANQQAPDLSGYATNASVGDQFQNFNPNIDLSGYATNDQLDNRFSNMPAYQAPDLSGYATNEDLQQGLSGFQGYDDSQLRSDINSRFSDFNPNVDLSGYATNDALSSAISGLPSYQAPDLSGYATNERLQQGLNSVQGYDDSQLRSDINSRFSNFNPNVDLSGYATNDQLDNRFNSMPAYQAPDLSGYATNESVSSQFDNFKPTGPAPYDDSGIMDLIRGNQSAIQNVPTYDDSQLRSDINSRFSNFNPNVDLSGYATNESVSSQFDNFKPTGPAPYDDSGIMDLIRGNQSAIQNVPTYDDSQLRNDIDDRFNSFQADAGVKPAPRDLWDDSVPVVNQGLDMSITPKMLQNFNRRKF